MKSAPQPSIQVKLIRLFIFSAGILLFTTGIAKLISSLGHDRILESRDPLFAISYRTLFRFIGLLELTIAMICFFMKRAYLMAGIIAWLASCFAIYRASMSWVGYVKPCHCLGTLTSAIHISPALADNIMKGVLVYLFVGSYVTLFCLWRQRKTVSASAPA